MTQTRSSLGLAARMRAMLLSRHKRNKTEPPKGVVDFQPDVASVENQQPDLLVRGTIYILLMLLASALVWSSLAEIDRVVVASGKIVTTGRDYVVQPLDKAIIRSINVGVGDIVKAGTPLVTLDPTFTEAELVQTKQKLDAARLQIMMLNSELDKAPFVPPSEFPPDMRDVAAKMYADRIEEYNSRKASQEESIATIHVDMESMKAQIKDLGKQLEIVQEVKGMRKKLYEEGADSKLNLLLVENNLISVNSQLLKAIFSLKDLEHGFSKSLLDKSTFVLNWRKETYKALLEAMIMRDSLLQDLAKQQRMKELVQLTAPADAVVLEIGKYSLGSVVREGDAVMTLVPLDHPLEAEVNISTADVAHVRVGDPCRIKLETLPFQKYGTLDGEVRTISGDTVQASGSSSEQPANQTIIAYKARIGLAPINLRNISADFRLIPGMTLSAEVMVGKRRVISYFLYPIIRTLDETIREP